MRLTATVAFAALLVSASCVAGEAPATKDAKPPAEGAIIKTLPGIVVDTKAKEVRLEAKVCQRQVGLELAVCSEGTREHESILVTKAKPSHVTFALALLGLEPGKPGFQTEGGAFSPPGGEVLDITARYTLQADGKKEAVEKPMWKFLRFANSDTSLEKSIDWVYVGQPDQDSLKASDNEGTVVALSNFRDSAIDVPFESTDVNANLLYAANPKEVPPLGTPVELVIRATGRRIVPQKVEVVVVLLKGKPPVLDGKSMDLDDFKRSLNAMPGSVKTAVLKADAEESFGRVIQVRDILEDALMTVRLVAIKADAVKAAGGKGEAVTVTLTADEKVRVGDKTMSVDDFRKQAATLLKGASRVTLAADPKAPQKTVVDLLTICREAGVTAVIGKAGAAEK